MVVATVAVAEVDVLSSPLVSFMSVSAIVVASSVVDHDDVASVDE